MARICPACGGENRDSAKFCLECAQQLVSLKPDVENKPAKTPRRRKKRKKNATAPDTRGQDLLWMVLFALALLALGLTIWRWGVQHGAAQPATSAQVASPVPSRAPESEALERTQQALRELQAQAEQQAAQRAAERAAENARQEAARQAAPAKAARRTDAPTLPPATERDSGITETVERLPPPSAPQPEPAPAPTPTGPLCASEGVFARSLCLQTECRKPAFAQHPDCVRMRELQESLQQSAGGG